MATRFLGFFHRAQDGVHEAAYLLGFFTLCSQLLALLRDRLFAAAFGAGTVLDAYFAAFRIPDLILIGVASLVSASVLVPLLVEKGEHRDSRRELVDRIFSVFSAILLLVAGAAFVAAPALLRLFFPAFADTPALFADTLTLTRIMLLQPLLLGVSNLFGSIVQAERRFFVYALAPLLYNGGIIVGVVFFYPLWGVAGLAWGVVFGALLHLAIQVPAVFRMGLFPRLTLQWQMSEFRRVVRHSLPRAAALGAGNLTTLFLLSLATGAGAGSIAVFTLAWNLQSVPLATVGVSYSLAAFPTLVRLAPDRRAFANALVASLSSIIFWSLPVAMFFIVLRAQIVRVILGAGAFSWTDTRLTAAALALFAISVVAQGAALLFVRAFYAAGHSWRPLAAYIGGGTITAILGWALLRAFTDVPATRFLVEGILRVSDVPGSQMLALPFAYSVGACATLTFLWFFAARRFGVFGRKIIRPFFESMGASLIGAGVAYVGLTLFATWFNPQKTSGVFFHGLFAGLIGIIAWVLVLRLLKSRELAAVWATVHQKIWRARPPAPDLAENPTISST